MRAACGDRVRIRYRVRRPFGVKTCGHANDSAVWIETGCSAGTGSSGPGPAQKQTRRRPNEVRAGWKVSHIHGFGKRAVWRRRFKAVELLHKLRFRHHIAAISHPSNRRSSIDRSSPDRSCHRHGHAIVPQPRNTSGGSANIPHIAFISHSYPIQRGPHKCPTGHTRRVLSAAPVRP